MSATRPECPLYNHASCKEAYIPKVCALVRDDKTCQKKHHRKNGRKGQVAESIVSGLAEVVHQSPPV